jgi:hypothetical protein
LNETYDMNIYPLKYTKEAMNVSRSAGLG